MAKGVLVVGESGSGKSTSIRTLDPKSTFIINVQGKDLPFKMNGYEEVPEGGAPEKGNLFYTDKIPVLLKLLKFISDKRPEITSVVIDDYQYAAVNEFMGRIKEKGFDKFNEIGHGIWIVPKTLPELRKDLMVYFLTHDEKAINDEGMSFRRAKRMGKLIDQQAGGLEGYFTMVIFTDVVNGDEQINHYFVTNNEGDTTAKTPLDMFDIRIPNDLALVDKTIREFYNI